MEMMDLVMRMIPYWFLGIFMIYATIKSGNKDILRFEAKPFAKWMLFICGLTVYRMAIFYFFRDHELIRSQTSAVAMIPWQASLTVFWEDMSFAVPLVLLSRLTAGKKYAKALNWGALALMMASFGSGHIYQGVFAALLLSLYVPISRTRGLEIGFGTMIACHMLYDLSTIMAIKMAAGF